MFYRGAGDKPQLAPVYDVLSTVPYIPADDMVAAPAYIYRHGKSGPEFPEWHRRLSLQKRAAETMARSQGGFPYVRPLLAVVFMSESQKNHHG